MLKSYCDRWLTPEVAIFTILLILFQAAYQERGFYDPGSLWHPVVGEHILDHGFMMTDPFTYTHEGRTWIPQQWGMEVLMALVKRAAGYDGLLFAFSASTAALFTFLFARLRSSGMHIALAGVFMAAVLFAGAFHFFVRPHMITIALLAWTMACLVDFDRGHATTARLAGLIPLYILWTNLHGGVLAGVFSFGIAYVGWCIQFLTCGCGPLKRWRDVWLVGAIVASCSLTPFDNPFGMEMIHTWQRIVGSPVLKEVVNEHKALDPSQLVDQLVIGFGVFYCLLFAGVLPRLRSAGRATWFIPLVWFVLSWKGIRQGPLFAITAGVVLADFWKYTIWHDLLKKYGDSLAYGTERFWTCKQIVQTSLLPGALIALGYTLVANRIPVPLIGAGWAKIDVMFHPIDLNEAIAAELNAYGAKARIWNDANLGGYLISQHPSRKIFMDDRFELYGDAWTRAYVDMLNEAPERIENYANEYRCTHALITILTSEERQRGVEASPLERYLSDSPGWQEVTRSQRFCFYRRILAPETTSIR